ncbi:MULTISPECIES: dicarboxylate/amino acid:cation symporter [unclassified Achromobacter]|uniref:dicarboxylate/amino acid:cation symporter n=1 Tax=unclassified Achromobacter TaxID=2626865 RepID=UPI000B51E2C7|nr:MULTISPECIES: dicarboxylate/amino acid:cation symporter [unclassified Achromobacter]OWT71638.1 dicarboxylate/amino acid:cation symporter [Achromobacter sp. HZ34]OWT73367.1 dicarboxylate/amino acid:cation symporter [Achromobacter sp. HZ28]
MKNRLTRNIGISMVLGLGVGYLIHVLAIDHATATTIAGYLSIVTEIFLRLIKMIIAPLIFTTLVSGIAGIGGQGTVSRLAGRAVAWFLVASLISLALGVVLANLLQPGAGMGLVAKGGSISTGLKTASLNLHEFLTHVFPTSIFDALARNEALQIVVFALFFGAGLSIYHKDPRVAQLRNSLDGIVMVMLKVTEFVMKFAPIGVFTALATAVAVNGLDVVFTYGKLVGSFYLGLVLLWMVIIFAGYLVLGKDVFRLLKMMRQPALIAFSTASSEAAYPLMTERLEQFGIRKEVVGFTLPFGYSFNLDGSMMYCTFAALFIAQAFGVELSVTQQITMLFVLLISSKGAAGVPRASVVVVAAVAPMFGLPTEGVLLILGIDQILDMGRTVTNVIGNSIATAALARLEGGDVPMTTDLVPGLATTQRD